jgi:hypothetical protein
MRLKFSDRPILVALIFILICLIGLFVRVTHQGGVFVPWGLMALFISFYLFSETNRVRKARREERRDYMNEQRKKLIEDIVKKKKDLPPDGDEL